MRRILKKIFRRIPLGGPQQLTQSDLANYAFQGP